MAKNVNKDEKYRIQLEERRKQRAAKEAEQKAAKRKRTLITTAYISVGVLLVVALALFIFKPWETKTTFTSGNGTNSAETSDAWADWEFKHDVTTKHHVEIDVKDHGVIKVELDPTYAPITVDNFLTLAESGFYDGLTFHRIMEGFMIQGGDPRGNGTGGSDVNIKGEFSSNGVNNPLKHERGVISMARSDDPNSASSQFFIMHEASPSLDGKYAAFGKVTEGMEIVDKIATEAKPTDSNGSIPRDQQPVITKITVID